MKNRVFVLLFLFTYSLQIGFTQNVIIEGYTFEKGNRGYLNQVNVTILDASSNALLSEVFSNKNGVFTTKVEANKSYIAQANKPGFHLKEVTFTSQNVNAGDKKFIEIEMEREPGYKFEITMAPKRANDSIVVDGITGAWVEVYNNTQEKEILNEKDYPKKEFNVRLEQGNHYTIMIRKDGYFSKRMEAYVNVQGCILCFDGIGSVTPGVVDNLTEGNQYGVLLANVELEPLFSGRTFQVENIYYDFAKATLRPEGKTALNQLSKVLKDNPHVKVELGSHTDSRGTNEDNEILSEARAKSAVEYLVNQLDIDPDNIIYNGYGEEMLKNECSDGVECTEVQHQQNRRTEIKILNIDGSKKLEKPLSQIRKEEMFKAKLLKEGAETIKVKEK